jgi:predicted kinase
MVRAKVAALSGDRRPDGDVAAYLQLALRQQQQPRPWLLLCHGVSGSGKSHLSGAVAAELGAIRLRSDVERKRWFGRWGDPALACRSGDPYAPAVSAELFGEQLPQRAEQILRAGFAVIVDATFLQQAHREPMTALAARCATRCVAQELYEKKHPKRGLVHILSGRVQERGRIA